MRRALLRALPVLLVTAACSKARENVLPPPPPPVDCDETPTHPDCPPIEPPPIDCTKTPTIAECLPPGPDCTRQPALPVAATTWIGDAQNARGDHHDADLALDGRGNLFGVDRGGNVFEQKFDGTRRILAPKAVKTARGLAFLSTGELVIADSGTGRLVKVYPDGQVRTLVRHLDYPSGLEVDARDRIYVAERLQQSIRRVDPRTGTSSVVADRIGLLPAGMAFSPDEKTLFVAGAEDGTIYAFDVRADETLSRPRVLSTVDGEETPCSGRREGGSCTIGGSPGTCQNDGTGALVCIPRGACDGRADGDHCRGDFFEPGTCTDQGFGFTCMPPSPCDGKLDGERCISEPDLTIGTCLEYPGQGSYCTPQAPCTGRLPGDTCDSGTGMPSICDVQPGWPELQCIPIDPCLQRSSGDSCWFDPSTPGVCQDDGFGRLYCQPTDPCALAEKNDPCLLLGTTGTCQPDPFGFLVCVPEDPCLTLSEGDACTTFDGRTGTCTTTGASTTPSCVVRPPCADAVEGSTCEDRGASGVCVDDFRGDLQCQTAAVCAGLDVGDVCRDPTTPGWGHCAKIPGGRTYCEPIRPCIDVPLGGRCYSPYTPGGGTCVAGPRSSYCAPRPVCEGSPEGTPCTTPDGWSGTCTDVGGQMVCETVSGCSTGYPGSVCSLQDGNEGVCANDDGTLVCRASDPCRGRSAGVSCVGDTGVPGVCADDGRGGNYCRWSAACSELRDGDACVSRATGVTGTCRPRAGGALTCEPTPPCGDRQAGEGCVGRNGATGVCESSGLGGAIWCNTGAQGRRPHAIATDACGWIYVTDDRADAVRRISPDGATTQLVSSTLHAPITSILWGSGAGGWKKDAIYLGVGGGAVVLEVPLGVAGSAIAEPTRTDAVAGPPDPAAIDCVNLPSAPISTTELDRPRGYHDVAFSPDGEIVGSDGSTLVAVDRQDALRVYAPNVDGVQGMDQLADGTLVVAAASNLVLVTPNGSVTTLASDISAYGVTVGPDEKVYAGDNGRVYRIDPVTREVDVYLDPTQFTQPWNGRTINFDVDHSLMYVGSFGDSIYVLPIDENLDPIGPPRHFARIRPGVHYLDGLAVDACGNLYVPNYESSALYRISPDGEVSIYWDTELGQYGHGVRFGRALGGWRTDALYLPQPYDGNTVIEVVTGVGTRP
ncbi:SMP-30/gluconolactonase/LRE family protein [Myxococcota bacterium]|nr:SMP-30/gluconolactonase/LRE family protein [Myxococcota bacterium]